MAKSFLKAHRGTCVALGLLLLGTALSLTFAVRRTHASDVDKVTVHLQQGDSNSGGKRLGLRLRSFHPTASGSLYFEPTAAGGVVRLTAIGMPNPLMLMPGAGSFVVWAVTTGQPPARVGELKVDASGNGGLEFPRPASFERYSVLVTAETNAEASNPAGVMVLATRAGAVSAFFGARDKSLNEARLKRLNLELGRRTARGRRVVATDFYGEVDEALRSSPGGGRTLELFGDEVTPDAHGLARVTSHNDQAYVRAAVTNLPTPASVGANTYVLWSLLPDGRIVYMGSLPSYDLNSSDIYIRVGGVSKDDFDLFVTAEVRRPVARPSALRALSTRATEDLPPSAGSIAGMVLDDSGRPIAGATVNAIPASQSGAGVAPPVAFTSARTDASGRFLLENVTPGRYVLNAAKEDEGYPSTSLAFFAGGGRTTEIKVNERQAAQNVMVQLGPKAARLTGRVVDGVTGQPIANAEMTLTRADNPNNYHITGPNRPGADFQLMVPSAPFTLKVTAPGYEDWYFGKDGTRAQAAMIQIEPSTTRELVIALRPVK